MKIGVYLRALQNIFSKYCCVMKFFRKRRKKSVNITLYRWTNYEIAATRNSLEVGNASSRW